MKRLHTATAICAVALAAPLVAPVLGPVAAPVIGPAFAQSANVESQPRAMLLGTPQSAANALSKAGMRVSLDQALSTPDLRRALSALYQDGGSGPLVIALNGTFAHGGGQTWLLGSDAAGQPTEPDLATVGGVGVGLDTVMAIAARHAGHALILLGDTDRNPKLGAGLEVGIGTLDIPQGVTVMYGPATKVSAFAGGALAQRGISLGALADAHSELKAEGYLSATTPFLPEETRDAGANSPSSVPPSPSDTGESAAWDVATKADTETALQAYLNRFPNGVHAEDARQQIAAIKAEPNRAQRQAEDALGLTRDQRRQVQRNLSLLGHDPKGIDGIFGPGTRAAISDWQASEGAAKPTGYLTAAQVAKLDAQAAVRQKQLEAEAAKRKQEQDRKDRAYWEDTGAKGDRAGLQAYLDRYPDGNYADVAQGRLDKMDAASHERARHEDRAAWHRAQQDDTVDAYRQYLHDQPDGAFADDAKMRIRQLRGGPEGPDRQAAQAGEEQLNMTGFTRTLVEKRLGQLGYDPGQADGQFDRQTRRAIRRFQRAAGLPPTGYLDRQTLVRLVAGAGQ
ncbi:peptidoglycan-binding domain-containing protein [Acidimangrovimonas sediminis]|uniref:peptidoglycan-binding domain-containing protein n=1 Tax=Acidimangrovimonas sediminis TaxID=2056283 RepID=UPI000C7F980C|nr:peptidoglycan-binding domain-containing protein [Acidimangrovimonas sediminis]